MRWLRTVGDGVAGVVLANWRSVRRACRNAVRPGKSPGMAQARGTLIRLSVTTGGRARTGQNMERKGPREEPDVDMINGRPSEEWEKEAIMRAKMERRAEAAALVTGIKPYSSSPDRHWPKGDEPEPKKKPRQTHIF